MLHNSSNPISPPLMLIHHSADPLPAVAYLPTLVWPHGLAGARQACLAPACLAPASPCKTTRHVWSFYMGSLGPMIMACSLHALPGSAVHWSSVWKNKTSNSTGWGSNTCHWPACPCTPSQGPGEGWLGMGLADLPATAAIHMHPPPPPPPIFRVSQKSHTVSHTGTHTAPPPTPIM